MAREGAALTLGKIRKRFLWNNPKKLLLFPIIKKIFPSELSKEDTEWAQSAHLKIKENSGVPIKATGYYKTTIEKVHEVLKIVDVTERVEVVKGWFQDTVPGVKQKIGPIALLRLDGDIYESTKYSLEQLYDQVVPGGYVMIDDFNLEGCRRALYEFFYKNNISPFIHNDVYGGRALFRK
jgi:hypothetical protein